MTIRRSITRGAPTTSKSGKSRTIKMPQALASQLFDLLAERRVKGLRRGWSEIPEALFCSEVGTPLDERNVTRTWQRIRRHAQKQGLRPLKLHAARHTWATLALRAANRCGGWLINLATRTRRLPCGCTRTQ